LSSGVSVVNTTSFVVATFQKLSNQTATLVPQHGVRLNGRNSESVLCVVRVSLGQV
jgi:hypothetical protein